MGRHRHGSARTARNGAAEREFESFDASVLSENPDMLDV
jgi:hypothetical protein